MLYHLQEMGLMLVYPRVPNLPCFVKTSQMRMFSELFPLIQDCENVVICNENLNCNETLMLMMVWQRGLLRQFVHCWVNSSSIHMGTFMVRCIQRAWLRFRERRRLALCMASHSRLGMNPLLAVVMRSLCDEDLRSFV